MLAASLSIAAIPSAGNAREGNCCFQKKKNLLVLTG